MVVWLFSDRMSQKQKSFSAGIVMVDYKDEAHREDKLMGQEVRIDPSQIFRHKTLLLL